MWFNDDDIEKEQTNWKNSEVTKLFVENYLDPMLIKEAKICEKCGQEHDANEACTNMENDCGDMDKKVVVIMSPEEEEDEAADKPLLKEEFIHNMSLVIRKLAAMAEQSDNEIVRYKIERAIIDLEAKKQGE